MTLDELLKNIQIINHSTEWIVGTYKNILFNIHKRKNPIVLSINGYRFECDNLHDAYSQVVDRIDNNKGIYLQSYRN